MNIGGLKNLGLSPQAGSAKGSQSKKDEASSFDDILVQADRDQVDAVPEKSQPQISRQAPLEKSAPQAKSSVQAKSVPAAEKSVEQNGLQPSAPTLDKPVITDRMMNMPVGQPVNMGAKQPTAVGSDVEVDSLTRRVVWQNFLRKMKDEFGISAEDMLSAFGSLSEEELAKPPAQTVDKVVMALGLDAQQAQAAKQYLMELINKTRPNSMGEELANSQKQISLTLMSQRELSRRNADRAVDQMQQKFFMNGAYQRPQDAMAAQPKGQLQQIPQAVMDAQGNVTYVNPNQQDENGMPMVAPLAEPVGSPMAPVKASATAVPNSTPINAQMMQSMEPVNTSAPKSPDVDALVKKFMAGQAQSSRLPMAEATAAAPAPVVPAANMSASAPAAAAAASSAAPMPINLFAASDSEDSGDYSEYTSDADYLGAIAAAEQGRQAAAPSEFQAQLNNTGAPAQPMAVPDLVQNAQVMVREGGGEMKVTLAPDGLGEVAMKVSVRDGKVSVQMITESDEAKKLIERQLGDLKVSLASQHLNVDGIKVETASNIGKQMEQQYQDAQRQMTQQNMEQFRQDQQGWRRSFFETPALKVYKGQAEAPRDIQAPTASSRKANNRRLDLVA